MHLRLLGKLVQMLRHGADAVVGHKGQPLPATLQLRQGLGRAGYKVSQRIPDDTCKQARNIKRPSLLWKITLLDCRPLKPADS